MANLENLRKVNLMVWETDPSKRSTNKEVKLNAKHGVELKKGDQIFTGVNANGNKQKI